MPKPLPLRWAAQMVRDGRTYLARRRNRRPLVSGPPPGLDWQSIDELSLQVRGLRLASVSYQHISGWKHAGAFRLHLTLQDASTWRVVFKDAFYGFDQNPGLRGYPAMPGPPEFDVLSQAVAPLAAYLPQMYRTVELEAGCHYQYWQEDLAPAYLQNVSEENLLLVVDALPALHRDLAAWGASRSLPGFIRYDEDFSARLREFTRQTLERFRQSGPDPLLAEPLAALLGRWEEISGAHAAPGFDKEAGRQPVHGDLHMHNVLLPGGKAGEGGFKLLDWEWAGWSQPHADLASLLKHRPPRVCRLALERYAAVSPGLSLEEHGRRLSWYRLDRALQDGAYMAIQILDAPPQTGMNVTNFMNNTIRQAQDSLEALQHGTYPLRENNV